MFFLETITNNSNETMALALDLAKSLKSGDLVALFGPMGVGKTTFIKGLALGLGLGDCVHSPTFSIVHEYVGDPPLIHFDMYRIESFADLESTAYFDYLDDGGVLAVEWSENIENMLPAEYIRVEISPYNDDTEKRRILITEVKKS